MRQPIVITTPYPTLEEIAQGYGVPPRRLKELQALVTNFLASSTLRPTKTKKRGVALPAKAGRNQSGTSER